MTLSIDIETFSRVDLKSAGLYKYVECPDFEILLFAYAIDKDPIQILDFASGDLMPQALLDLLVSPMVTKTAFNAVFEITCISKFFNIELYASQWDCTMVRAAMAGLPLSLGTVAKAMGLQEQKMADGAALIRYFSIPCKPSKVNQERTRNLPYHNFTKWDTFKEYCIQDVVTEKAIRDKLLWLQITDNERNVWRLDQEINRRGVMVDMLLVDNAIRIDAINRERLTAEATDLTGLDNPNSVAQLKEWIREQMDAEVEIESLSKDAVKQLIESTDDVDLTQLLKIRQELGKTSVKKYAAMAAAVCADGRVRGLLQYYGANRTGRWAGRIVQVQNLPQNHLPDLDLARNLLRDGDLESLMACYGNVPSVLSELIRTAFVAKEGHTFAVADFSAIEARVIAWLADEKWRLDVFNTHGKIYEASAAQMFKVPIESVTKGSPLRQKGKIAELALGYQGSVGALTAMDSRNEIAEDEKQQLVYDWRNANRAIVRLWGEVERAAIMAVDEGTTTLVRHNIKFIGGRGMLFIELPSGRRLSYVRPRLVENRFGKMAIQYEGMEQTKKVWGKLDTYGGKLVENIVQAIARDCLSESMLRLDAAGYKIVMHVHDEAVIEIPETKASETLKDIERIMGESVSWAKGLPLRADGYITKYYKKD